MTLIRNLFFLFTVTLFATASLVLDIFNYNPFEASGSQFASFYISALLSLAGIFAFSIYYSKMKWIKENTANKDFWPSVRQGLLISLIIVTLLFLKGLKLLDLWVGGSILVVIVLLELFFQTKKPKFETKK